MRVTWVRLAFINFLIVSGDASLVKTRATGLARPDLRVFELRRCGPGATIHPMNHRFFLPLSDATLATPRRSRSSR